VLGAVETVGGPELAAIMATVLVRDVGQVALFVDHRGGREARWSIAGVNVASKPVKAWGRA
jgi:hypothetical protein